MPFMADKSTAFLMFGATGDLARRMLLPSLYGLDSDGLLAPDLNIVGTARSDLDADGFRTLARQALEEHLPDGVFEEEVAARFLARLDYVTLDINDEQSFARLAKAVGDKKPRLAIFLSTAPSLFEPVIAGLESVGLASSNVRLALEKPLGSDLASSKEINDAVAARFAESQIFRVDHYLGKEGVQNLLALRFGNALFEPLWNNRYVDHVQITGSEAIGIEGRGGYFDTDGTSKRRAFLASPMEFSRVTSGFAMRFHPLLQNWRKHLGVDYGAPTGTAVRSVGDGVVDFAGWQNGYGNVVQVKHAGDRSTLYAHLSRMDVRKGQRIQQGQRLGAVGTTGWSTGPHLHFEFQVAGQHRDPLLVAKASETVPLDAASRPRFAELVRTVKAKLDVAETLVGQRGQAE